MRRFATLALSLSMVLGLTGYHHLFAQGEAKKETPKAESKKEEAPSKPEAAKTDAAKADTTKPAEKAAESKTAEPAPAVEPPLPPIPPEVEAKLEAARKAVAEAIVAAEDAGLVQTTIDPPPILDILITGRATDERTLKARHGANPEVFGAWFSGYGKSTSGLTAQKDVRIIQPADGLKDWYDQRAAMLNRHIDAVRKAKGTPAKTANEPKKDEAKKDEAKKDEAKKDEAKKDEAKKDAPKKDEAKKDETKKDGSKDAKK